MLFIVIVFRFGLQTVQQTCPYRGWKFITWAERRLLRLNLKQTIKLLCCLWRASQELAAICEWPCCLTNHECRWHWMSRSSWLLASGDSNQNKYSRTEFWIRWEFYSTCLANEICKEIESPPQFSPSFFLKAKKRERERTHDFGWKIRSHQHECSFCWFIIRFFLKTIAHFKVYLKTKWWWGGGGGQLEPHRFIFFQRLPHMGSWEIFTTL